jgi:hypothetical protein
MRARVRRRTVATRRGLPDALSSPLRDAEDQHERPLRACPELADQRLAARTNEVAEDERDDDRVVEQPIA